jgi:hypothetical protein
MKATALLLTFACVAPVAAQEADWNFGLRSEVRAHYRDSEEARFQLAFPFPEEFLPRGEKFGFEETVDAGKSAELGLASLQFDLAYRNLFAARAKVDFVDLFDRNPTSGDRKTDGDELWIRFGPKPERLDLPGGTSFFFQAGKAPKMERQPVRMLESYGLASTSFNRFEDVQLLVGGSVGRNFYWRGQASNGNPLFFRDPNALAGDNGIAALREPFPDPELKSGFPILYDAESEDYFLDFDQVEAGGGIGWRWQNGSGDGFDVLVFGYRRKLAETVELEGTFYGGDLDLLDGAFGIALATSGDEKSEVGIRLYAEIRNVSVVAQFIAADAAGLERSGAEIELGYQWEPGAGPAIGGRRVISSLQPALRISHLENDFNGPPAFVAPSLWWDWTKYDVGVRIEILERVDLTIERAIHDIDIAREVEPDETLVTLRVVVP